MLINATIILLLVVTLLLLFLLYKKLISGQLIHGGENFWVTQNVPFVNIHKMASFFKRAIFKVSLRELDQKLYDALANEKFGGYMEFKTPILYVKDPDLLKMILVKDFDHFSERKFLGVKHGDPIISRTLTNMTGTEWKDVRALWSPTFTTAKIRRMCQVMNFYAAQLASHLDQQLMKSEPTEKVLDFQNLFCRYTVDVITSITFFQEQTISQNNASIFREIAHKFQQYDTMRLLKLVIYFFMPSFGRIAKLSFTHAQYKQYFSHIVTKHIDQRRDQDKSENLKERRQDFLETLLQGKDKDKILDDRTIVAQCYQFFNAGSDTIESLLTFALYSLALNQDIQDKLAADVSHVMDSNKGELTYEATCQMEYLDMVVSETLRMYPPACATERTCTRDYTLPGTSVKLYKGCRLVLAINGLHHDEKYWDNPGKFNPENFSAENKQKRHPYTFLPFSHGPRSCLGSRFTMVEAKVTIAHLIHKFKFEPAATTEIPIQYKKTGILLKPLNGMPLKFSPRNNNF